MHRHWYAIGFALLGAVFGVLAATVMWLFFMAALACFAIGFGVERGTISRARFAAALPFEVSMKPRTIAAPRAAPPLGILDFELAFEQEGGNLRRGMERVSNEVQAVGSLMERYTPRFGSASELTAKEKVALSREFAGRLRPHAKRMAMAEGEVKRSTDRFIENYLKRIESYTSDTDIGPLRPSIASLHQSSLEARGSIRGYRDAIERNRKINLQQAMNEVLDHLRETAGNILLDVDQAIEMSRAALEIIDGRASTTGVNRAERRRHAKDQVKPKAGP
jgi:hypothetical protein